MLKTILNVFAPPLTTEHRVRRTAVYVRVLLLTLTLAFALVLVFNRDWPSKLAAGLMIAFGAISLAFLVRGNMTIPRLAIPAISLGVLSTLVALGLGLHSVTVPALPVVIVAAALLAGRGAALAYMLLEMTVLALIYAGEHSGWIDNGYSEPSNAVELMNIYLGISVLTAALCALMRHIEIDRDDANDKAAHALELIEHLRVQAETLKDQQVEIKRRETQYSLLAENVYDFIWTVDLGLRLTFASPASLRLLGYAPEEMIGKPLFDTVHPESIAEIVRVYEQELSDDSNHADPNRHATLEIQGIRKDGQSIWIELSAAFLRNDAGAPVGIVGTSRDISQRKAAELQSHELEGQLRQTQKIDSIGQLAGGIAHDFNNLLVAILGYTELAIADLSLSDRARSWLAEVHKSAERAADLTRQLLTFARRQVVERRPLDLCHSMSEMRGLLARLIPENIELEFDLKSDVWTIQADPGQVEQLIVNLSLNARDAILDRGKIAIAIENIAIARGYADFHPGAHAGDYVRLSVTDTGTGMDAATQARIFEPFFTTKDMGQGTGLGMSVVHGIVVQHGGFIDIRSAPGKGSTISIYFPATESHPRTVSPAIDEPAPGGNETILLVEDEDSVRALAQRVLAGAGYNVLAADNGKSGVELFESNNGSIALVVSDVVMPIMGGRELLEAIRRIDSAVPILFSSGYLDKEVTDIFVPEENLHFIDKPYTPKKLLRSIRDVLDGITNGRGGPLARAAESVRATLPSALDLPS